MDQNSEGIFGSRPWKVYGEGPSTVEKAEEGRFGGARDVRSKPYTSEDIRFTTKAGKIYAYFLAWPADGKLNVRSFAKGGLAGGDVTTVALLGSADKLTWTQESDGLHVVLPAKVAGAEAWALRVELAK
jgi:alpha-L-fucosidase